MVYQPNLVLFSKNLDGLAGENLGGVHGRRMDPQFCWLRFRFMLLKSFCIWFGKSWSWLFLPLYHT